MSTDPLDDYGQLGEGDGGIFSTVEDLFKWDQALYGEKLVKTATLRQAFMPGRLKNGAEVPYGFGWALGTFRGLSYVQHGGGLAGFRAHIVRFPEQRFTVILLANLAQFDPWSTCNQIAEVYLSDQMEARPIMRWKWDRFSGAAQRAVFLAKMDAAQLGDSSVGTEHLLLGLLGVPDGVAARSLSRLGIPVDRVRLEIERQVTRSRGRPQQEMEFSGLARAALDYADQEAQQSGDGELDTQHLLLGLLDVGYGLGGKVLADLGVSVERLRATIEDIRGGSHRDLPE